MKRSLSFTSVRSSAVITLTMIIACADARPERPAPPAPGTPADVARVEAIFNEYIEMRCENAGRCPAVFSTSARRDPLRCRLVNEWLEEREVFGRYAVQVEHGLVIPDEDGVAACRAMLMECTDQAARGCEVSSFFKGTRPVGAPCITGAECGPDAVCNGLFPQCSESDSATVCVPIEGEICETVDGDPFENGLCGAGTEHIERRCRGFRCERRDRAPPGPTPIFVDEGGDCSNNFENGQSARTRVCNEGLLCDASICVRIPPATKQLGDECLTSNDACDASAGLACAADPEGQTARGRCRTNGLAVDAVCGSQHGVCGSGLACLKQPNELEARGRCRPTNVAEGQSCAAGVGLCSEGLYCTTDGVCTPTALDTPCLTCGRGGPAPHNYSLFCTSAYCPFGLICDQTFPGSGGIGTCSKPVLCE